MKEETTIKKNRQILLEVKDLKKYFPIQKGFLKKHIGDVKAVDGVSFIIRRGEILGLVGESGCGKTTTGRLVLRAYAPTSGKMFFYDRDKVIDLTSLEGKDLLDYRRKAQMIFQDPYSSLNPRMTVLQIVGEPLLCLENISRNERKKHVKELLKVVGLDPRYAGRYPHAFSGGQRQRIGIARVLAPNPDFIVADEAVSALDVSIQAQIINLLEELQNRYRLTMLFISHDLGVVKHISNRVAVMYVGKIVELSETDELFRRPRHPYTEALLSAVPQSDPDHKLNRIVLQGDVADPANLPSGCVFHPRCPYRKKGCQETEPPLVSIGDEYQEHFVACHFASELKLKGVLN